MWARYERPFEVRLLSLPGQSSRTSAWLLGHRRHCCAGMNNRWLVPEQKVMKCVRVLSLPSPSMSARKLPAKENCCTFARGLATCTTLRSFDFLRLLLRHSIFECLASRGLIGKIRNRRTKREPVGRIQRQCDGRKHVARQARAQKLVTLPFDS